MKIRIESTTVPKVISYVAAGDREAPSNFKINGTREVQIAEFLRGAEVKPLDRGNQKTVVSFDVTRLHATLLDAEVFILQHATDLPGSGLVVFEAIGSNGQTTLRWIRAGVINSTLCAHIGITTLHSYEIIGGQILKQKPV